ncbi:MAG: hypothetical protein IJI14_11190 [Anaerolineaceae bacterium]|nr:hypothetical protein [Anaerolineaceae bacterium]
MLEKELEDSLGSCGAVKKAVNIWLVLSFLAVIPVSVRFILMNNWRISPQIPFLMQYVILFCLHISLADFYTRSFFLEMTPFLALLPVIGGFSFGFRNMLLGLIGGLVISGAFLLFEKIFTGKSTYGGGDVLAGTAYTGLATILFALHYWMAVSILMLVCFIVIMIYGKLRKGTFLSGKLIPLLPVLSMPACLIYWLGVSGKIDLIYYF